MVFVVHEGSYVDRQESHDTNLVSFPWMVKFVYMSCYIVWINAIISFSPAQTNNSNKKVLFLYKITTYKNIDFLRGLYFLLSYTNLHDDKKI